MTGFIDHRMQDMAHGPRVPRITTRGSYCLENGKAVVSRTTYRLYPQGYFEDVVRGSPEVIIVIHGLRNDSRGALEKVTVARNMLARLRPGRQVPPVVGFSYDSNTLGAHIKSRQIKALAAGRRIARANGKHLARFVLDFKSDAANARTQLRLIGHSLGSEVIFHAIMHLAYGLPGGLSATTAAATAPASAAARLRPHTRGIIEDAHLFGSSLPADIQGAPMVRRAIDHAIRGRLVSYYAPTDDVLLQAASEGIFQKGAEPLGLRGALAPVRQRHANSSVKKPVTAGRYMQRRVSPADHRFASYADALGSFP